MIPFTEPLRVLPVKAEFFDFDRKDAAVMVTGTPGSNKVKQAGASFLITGMSSPNIFLGLMLTSSTHRLSVSAGKMVLIALYDVSSPVIPYLAYSNSSTLLSYSCGR